MNRLKFSEGGQPMYLEDLETLQDNDTSGMKQLLEALTGGESVYLLQEVKGELTGVDWDKGESTFKVYGGGAVVKGELVTWEETTVTVTSWDDPLYLCLKRSETDNRVFEDGQTRACQEKVECYISTGNSGVEESYMVWDLPVMTTLMKKALGMTAEPSYQKLDVSFRNGYTGSVMYKELTDVYRYKIDIKSTNTTALTGSVSLFYAGESLPGAKGGVFVTPTKAFVATENGVTSFELRCFEGMVTALVSLPFDDVSTAADLPVKMIFDLPKL